MIIIFLIFLIAYISIVFEESNREKIVKNFKHNKR